jgi:Domain of unknown function (DUF1929)
MRVPPKRSERLLRVSAILLIVTVIAAVNLPTLTSAAVRALHEYKINSQSYKEREGHWSTLNMPPGFKVNAVHAALLYTGKVLIVAGSGNNVGDFKAGTFKSIVWNPRNNKFKLIHTPSDMFCGGHFFLPDGKLLIAGGTRRYEVLANKIVRAAGVMTIQDQAPAGGDIHLPAGSEFTSPSGIAYRSTEAATIKPASKAVGPNGRTTVTASSYEIWVEAVNKGHSSVIDGETHFAIAGIHGVQARNLFGLAAALNMEKQQYWGNNKSYLFNPANESYERVSNLNIARWYPSLVGLKEGRVLAVSGLNQFGQMIQGQTETYTPATKRWAPEPRIHKVLPTYPALFLMPDGNLFYSGSNAGYGSATVGRTPGIWNMTNNSFHVVPGLQDPNETETSGSVLLPPAQAQKYMIAGGGGVGSSPESTARTAIADLNEPEPHWKPGPKLAKPTRYPSMVITPNGKLLITGGSRGYRGEHDSDNLECHVYEPSTNKLTALASPTIGRDYHSEALLLPDGRIVTLGSNPLYANKADTIPGGFNKQIEIYSPPYLYHGTRPKITGGPQQIQRGETIAYKAPSSSEIETANLLRPSAVTHVTDLEQRSIALYVTDVPGGIRVRVPTSEGLVPSGWYMLFVNNREATPSDAYWVHVS